MPPDHPQPASASTGSAPGDRRLLITGGPTHEPIDGVRYIGNRSSGQLAVALAIAGAERGVRTTLLLGPSTVEPPESTGLEVIRFRTTEDLGAALEQHWPHHDVLVMAAAVADYRPVADPSGGAVGTGKIRRTAERLVLELEPTPDLLAGLAATSRPDQTTIGFALEPAESLMERAQGKLERKHLDAIVANPLETMDASTITATLLLRTGAVRAAPPDIPKRAFAEWLLDRLPEVCDQPPPSNAST